METLNNYLYILTNLLRKYNELFHIKIEISKLAIIWNYYLYILTKFRPNCNGMFHY